jgi:hypothetical protein
MTEHATSGAVGHEATKVDERDAERAVFAEKYRDKPWLPAALKVLEDAKGFCEAEMISAIRQRHAQIVTSYGDEPWDENCIEDGEQAHLDREYLLSVCDRMRARAEAWDRGEGSFA